MRGGKAGESVKNAFFRIIQRARYWTTGGRGAVSFDVNRGVASVCSGQPSCVLFSYRKSVYLIGSFVLKWTRIVRDTERFSVAGEARSRLRDTFSYGDLHLPPGRDVTNKPTRLDWRIYRRSVPLLLVLTKNSSLPEVCGFNQDVIIIRRPPHAFWASRAVRRIVQRKRDWKNSGGSTNLKTRDV